MAANSCPAIRIPIIAWSRQAPPAWASPGGLAWLCLVFLLMLAGCSRAPDAGVVQEVVEERLQSAFQEPVLEVSSLRRLGSAPLSAAGDGTSRQIVYYNARFTLMRDYQFSDWDALNPTALASLLGASEPGITGIDNQGNQAGDELLVRGSVTFRQEAGNWVPTQFVPPAAFAGVAATDEASANARALVEPIMRRFEAVPKAQVAVSRAIIIEELEEAVRQIDLRLDNLQQVLVVAGGPAGGEYDLVAKIIADFNNSQGVRAGVTVTDGSVRNAQLIRDDVATVGLVQNDVALMAYEGLGPFTGDAATSLRALGSLFPEPVQIVVRADGPASVEALRGLRVDLGMTGSGSRATALRVLEAYGLKETDVQASALGSVAAGEALVRDEIDAFFTIINAPARHLQRLAADHPIRMLSLAPHAIAQLTEADGTLVPLTLSAGTYPGQTSSVHTVGVAALLVGDANIPNAEVRRLLQNVYADIDFVAAGSAAGAMISPQRARTGVTIPMHPGADVYFDE